MLIITCICILREYTTLFIDKKLNQRTAYVYFAGDDDVNGATGPLSHPATNRNVYFTRRKLAPRACAKGDVRCVALSFCVRRALSSSPSLSRSCLLSRGWVTPVINFAEFGSTHRVREAHVRNRQLTSRARKSCRITLR